jgi:tetratricopeptide (TPR) repeat protein
VEATTILKSPVAYMCEYSSLEYFISKGINCFEFGRKDYAEILFRTGIIYYPGSYILLECYAASVNGGSGQESLNTMMRSIFIQGYSDQGFENLAQALESANLIKHAIKVCKLSVAQSPSNSKTLTRIGTLLLIAEDYRGAIKYLKKSIKCSGLSINSATNLSKAYEKIGLEEMVTNVMSAIFIVYPSNVNPLVALARHFIDKNIPYKCLKYSWHAIVSEPYNSNGHSILSFALHYSNQKEKSLYFAKVGAVITPGDSLTVSNISSSFQAFKNSAAADSWGWRASYLNNNDKSHLYNKAIDYLFNENYLEGFRLYQNRKKSIEFKIYCDNNDKIRSIPPDKNEPLLVIQEQGIGDVLLYSRLLGLLMYEHKNITLAVDKRLVKALKRSFRDIKVVEDIGVDFYSKYKYIIMLGDIATILSVSPSSLASLAYPHILPIRKEDRLRKLFPGKIICGISWKSNRSRIGHDKSIPVTDFGVLHEIDNVILVCLQYGDISSDVDMFSSKFGREFFVDDADLTNDLDHVFSLIYQCDFIVTSSNTVAHMAGSIGKDTISLISSGVGCFWYWSNLRSGKSIWYPSVRVIKMDGARPTNAVIKEAAETLITSESFQATVY